MSYQEYKVKVYSDRTEWYNLEGQRHRDSGPAIEYSNGGKYWYQHGKLHRDDGPAIEYASGYKEWYLEGKRLTEAEFNARQQPCEGKVVEIEGKKYKLVQV